MKVIYEDGNIKVELNNDQVVVTNKASEFCVTIQVWKEILLLVRCDGDTMENKSFYVQASYEDTGNIIGAYVPHPERNAYKPGFWGWLRYKLSTDECVAKIDKDGEWCKEGWGHALQVIREKAKYKL